MARSKWKYINFCCFFFLVRLSDEIMLNFFSLFLSGEPCGKSPQKPASGDETNSMNLSIQVGVDNSITSQDQLTEKPVVELDRNLP